MTQPHEDAVREERHNSGMPRQVDTSAFKVGENLTTTPGAVVFRNEVLELIHYQPVTETVSERPLLMVPPQINKFYVFDLSPQKSLVKYALSNGPQVFLISWRNPTPAQHHWGLDTYVGAIEEAMEAVCAITGSPDCNLLGACSGIFDGTRLSYAAVNAAANQVANVLTQVGIHKGETVALSCPNVPYFPIVYYGILMAIFNRLDRERKPGSIGLPVWGVSVRVVDQQDQDVGTNDLGEIIIRGHNVMKGYYKRPEATAEAMGNGWFHTGDIGRRDEEGYLSIADRLKDMIIRGGFNVYPREIEEVLMTHQVVSLAAVVGVPDARHGEEVKAFVILKEGAEVTEAALIAWAKQNMADYKYPRLIEFRTTLPMTATGKVLKSELRQEKKG